MQYNALFPFYIVFLGADTKEQLKNIKGLARLQELKRRFKKMADENTNVTVDTAADNANATNTTQIVIKSFKLFFIKALRYLYTVIISLSAPMGVYASRPSK